MRGVDRADQTRVAESSSQHSSPLATTVSNHIERPTLGANRHLVFASAPPPSRQGLTRNILIDYLAALLAGGIAAQAWALDDPEFTAVFLFNALHGVVNQDNIDGSAGDRRKLLSHIDAHFLRAVGL